MLIAHAKQNKVHPLKTHLTDVAKRCEAIAIQKGIDKNKSKIVFYAALLHDLGKAFLDFQQKISDANQIKEISPEAINRNLSKNPGHALEGARILYRLTGRSDIAELIFAHHSGLHNKDDATATMENKITNDNSYDKQLVIWARKNLSLDFNSMINELSSTPPLSAIEIRILFSVLIDSDRLDTEAFFHGVKDKANYDASSYLTNRIPGRINNLKPADLLPAFSEYMRKKQGLATGPLSKRRTELFNSALEKSAAPRGFFFLRALTGFGKTLSSLAFALNHAKEHNLDRVIYTIPFTSIIDQAAAEFRNIFSDFDNPVLEHHSGKEYEDDGASSSNASNLKKLEETWDKPIVVTTNVQFLESLASRKTSKVRKLHNVINSVIVFDEIQAVPQKFLKPVLNYLKSLVDNWGCTVVLCSATIPPFADNSELSPYLENMIEINDCHGDDVINFNRVDLFTLSRGGGLAPGLVADARVRESDWVSSIMLEGKEKSVLAIAQTRKGARELYESVPFDRKYLLTALMYPVHRRKILSKIREDLKNNKKILVVSTSLVEAGVDVDFPVVYREIAGYDSLVQSAGRCNREGKLSRGKFIAVPMVRSLLPGSIKSARDICYRIVNRFTALGKAIDNLLDPSALNLFYEEMFSCKVNALDGKGIIRLEDQGNLEKVSDEFHLIDDIIESIVVSCAESEALLSQLEVTDYPLEIIRKLGQYSVSVYGKPEEDGESKGDYAKLQSSGMMRVIGGLNVVDGSMYFDEFGLVI